MKRLVVIAITIMFGLANIPMPASADIVVDKDGSYELSDLIITEIASGSGQKPAIADCETFSGDFVEIYASTTTDLTHYQLFAKTGTGEKELELPPIELSAGTTTVTGCVDGSDRYRDANLLASGEIWLKKGAETIDSVIYGNMGGGESWERDICGNKMVLSSKPSPGSFNANVECDAIPEPAPQYCSYLIVSELDANEKWVEIYNSYPDYVYPENLENCLLMIQSGTTKTSASGQAQRSYQTAVYHLADYGEIAPGEYMVINVLTESKMTMAGSSGIKDRAVIVQDSLSLHSMGIYNYHKAGTSWSLINQAWLLTYAPTPGKVNVYQQYQTCEAGKHINEATGNCVKDPDPPAECAEGQYRNPETGRCKKYAEASVLAECAEGQYRNPETNRCKKYATTDDLVPCAEGYERNPETNRCRKIRASGDAEYAVEPMGVSTENNTWAIIGAVGLGAIGLLIILQFRHEIASGFNKIFRRKK